MLSKTRNIARLLLLFSFANAQTQDSVPSPLQKFLKNLHYKWTNDAIWQTGNVERFLYNTTLSIAYADSIIDFEIKPIFSYGEVSQKQNDRIIKGIVQEREQILNLHVGLLSPRKLYGFGLGTLERSNLRKIAFRWQAGLGIGWHILRAQDKKQKLNFTIALIREETDFAVPTTPDYHIFRASARLSGKYTFFQGHLIFYHTISFMPSLRFDNNRRFTSNLVLEVPISKRLQLRSSFDYTYEGVVPANIRKVDTKTLVGIVVSSP